MAGLRTITAALLGLEYRIEPTPSPPLDLAVLTHDPDAMVREEVYGRVEWRADRATVRAAMGNRAEAAV